MHIDIAIIDNSVINNNKQSCQIAKAAYAKYAFLLFSEVEKACASSKC